MNSLIKSGFSLVSLTILMASQSAFAIKKCKDAEGKWHYGDTAEEACETTKVTTLSNRGFVKDTLEAPKTEEERKVEEELKRKEEEELARIKKEQEEKDRVLSIYEREEDIDRQRDNKLASVDGNIRVHKAYLKQMDAKIARLTEKSSTAGGKYKLKLEKELAASKSRVSEFSTELERLIEQRKSIEIKFAEEKKLYRELKAS